MSTTDERLTPAAARTEWTALAAGLLTVTLCGSSFVAIRDAGQTLSLARWRSAGCSSA